MGVRRLLLNTLLILVVSCITGTIASSCPFRNGTSACKDWENEVRMSQLEAKIDSLVQEIAVLRKSDVERMAELKVTREMLKKCLSRKEPTWQLKRIDLILPKLQKMQLSEVTPTIVDKVNLSFPATTKAIIVSVFCNFWNEKGHAYLIGELRQNGNNDDGTVQIFNQHYNVYANTWYYEIMLPWDTSLPNELELKVTTSFITDGIKNWYTIKIVGFVSI